MAKIAIIKSSIIKMQAKTFAIKVQQQRIRPRSADTPPTLHIISSWHGTIISTDCKISWFWDSTTARCSSPGSRIEYK
jgi:hypothetical protein